eukprot:6851000-Pyramimonas_sp.AAC.1
MKGVSNLHRMEENTNAAVGRVEMMELMMLKREMSAELPHLRTIKSTVLGLNDRVDYISQRLLFTSICNSSLFKLTASCEIGVWKQLEALVHEFM